MSDLVRLTNDVALLMGTRFPDHTVDACAIKCATEAQEFAANPNDITEAADVLITLLAWLHVNKVSVHHFLDAAERKMRVNFARTWERQPDGTYQHVEVRLT